MTPALGRVSVALLLPAAVLAGHAVGYGAGHHHGAGAAAHGYLPAAGELAALLAAAGILVAAISGPSWRPTPRGVMRLAGTQSALFLMLELGEHAVSGVGAAAALASQPVWIGLGAQLALAAVTVLLLSSVAATGLRLQLLLRRPQAVMPPRSPRSAWVGATPARQPLVGLVPARGPPPG